MIKEKERIDKLSYFEVIAEIEATNFLLSKLSEHNNKSTIITMIDKATGNDKREFKENVKTAIHLLENLILLKDKINIDTKLTKKYLNKILLFNN